MLSKNPIALAAVFLITCLLEANFNQAQSKSNILYAQPTRLMLKGDKNSSDENDPNALLREKFYPIGWSKDGKFAYYVEPADEACGCYIAQLIVQDLWTDKILWRKSYNSENGGADTLAKYWKKNQAEFSRQLAAYKIIAKKNFTLFDSTFDFQTDVLSPEIDVKTSIDADQRVSGKVILRLLSKQKGRKTIHEKTYVAKNYDSFRNAEIAGSLLSPFEARAAIIVVETHRGWEGPPNITRIRINGAALTVGFR